MTREQLEALMAYIDAKVEARMVRDSCGPHVAEIRQRESYAKGALMAAFR